MPILATLKPTFQPAMRIIATVSSGFPCTVTTTFAHNYITGMIVRLNIPPQFGLSQANGKQSPIIVTSDTTFTMNIDTTFMDPYVPSSTFPFSQQYGQVTPVGELNETLLGATRNVLPYSAS